uniref:Uncharacterized protein n=1 Tax=Aplanochytrium stocchinoi TaxID=215587 RepID=A0A7S3LLG9_9STRA
MALIKGKVSKIQRLFAEKIKAKKRKFYRPPAVRQRWDEEQEELENTWGELFFDLIFVAVAFKVGDLIVADFELGKYDRGLLFAYSTFVILYDAWQDRTLFLSRFVTDDSFHKLLDIISGFVTAVMAFSIVTPEEFLSMGEGRFNYALMLSSGKIIQLTIDMFKMWEFRYFSNHREQGITLKQHVTPTMSVTFRNYYIAASLITVAIYTSYIGYIRTTCFLWLASSIVPRQITFLAVLYWRNYQRSIRAKRADTEEERDRINSEGSGVPINVQFFIDRLYEFVMLLNGEGVLQVSKVEESF